MLFKNTVRKNQTCSGMHSMIDSDFTVMRHTIQHGQPCHRDIHVKAVITSDLICIFPEVISNNRYFLIRHDEMLVGLFDAAKVALFYAIHLRISNLPVFLQCLVFVSTSYPGNHLCR